MASTKTPDRAALLARLEVPGPDRTGLLTRDSLHRLVECVDDDQVNRAIAALLELFEETPDADEAPRPSKTVKSTRRDREEVRRFLRGEIAYVTFEEWGQSLHRRLGAAVFRILHDRGRLRQTDLTA